MNSINILFDIPECVQRGLADGSMRLFGGTVRHLNGRIVAHLVPGKLISDSVEQGLQLDPSALTLASGDAQSSLLLNYGIAALGLSLNASGFAAMRQKLNAIMDRLDKALDELGRLKEDVEWVKNAHLSHLRGDIDSACDLASRAKRLQDQDLFKEARTSAHKTRRRMVHALRDLLKRKRVISRRREFAELVEACVVLAAVEASCDEAVEGVQQSICHVTTAAQDLTDMVAQFELQWRDFRIDTAARIRLGPAAARELGEMTADLRKSTESLHALAGQMEFRGLVGVGPEKWRDMTAPDGSKWFTCVVPPDTAEPSLLAIENSGSAKGAS